MLLSVLYAENVVTFEEFELTPDGQSLVVVGPNGSGKSNIVRVVDLVGKALDWATGGPLGSESGPPATQVLESFAAARHHGQPSSRGSVIRLSVEWTTAAERERIAVYVRAAALSVVLTQLRSAGALSGAGGDLSVDAWIESQLTEDVLTPLFSGTIVLRHIGMPHVPWEVGYEFVHNGVRYCWLFAGLTVTPGIVRVDAPPQANTGRPPTELLERLLGQTLAAQPPVTLPDPLPEFTFDALCPAPGEWVAAPAVHLGGGVVDQRFPVFRRAIERLGLPLPESASNRMLSVAFVLGLLFTEGVIIVGEQFRGLGMGGTPPQQPGPYPWEALVSSYRSHAPAQLPLRLFQLKNGNAADRARFTAIQSLFAELAPGRMCDVTFQPFTQAVTPTSAGAGQVALVTSPTGPGAAQGQPVAAITVVIDRTSEMSLHPNDLPIQLHGAGVWEALVLAEALTESAHGRVVVLDEPGSTFHPTWQRALRSRLRASLSQIVLVTHSADLVPMDSVVDLARLVRVDNETGRTRAHRLDVAALPDDQALKIIRELALSPGALALLFARGVVLVEGDTEAGLLPEWFTQGATRDGLPTPTELDVAIYSVHGDGQFRPYLTVLNAFAIPWAVICDGAAFNVADRQEASHIFRQVIDAGIHAPELVTFLDRVQGNGSPITMSANLFEEQKTLGQDHAILTLAPGWTTANKKAGSPGDESFEVVLDRLDDTAREQAKRHVGDNKVRVGLWIGKNRDCPPEISKLYRQTVAALRRRGMTALGSRVCPDGTMTGQGTTNEVDGLSP